MEQLDLVPIKKVMPLLGQTNETTCYGFCHRNGVPFYRIGKRKMLFDLDEVRAWIQSRRVGPPIGNRAAPAVKAAIFGNTEGKNKKKG